MNSLATSTLTSTVSQSLSSRRAVLRAAVRIVCVVLLTSLAAQLRIPVPGTDVPVTLQLLVVLVVGLALPVAEAVAGMALYVLLGAAGIPVLSPGSAGFMGPTGGYLLGFVAAVVVMAITCRGGHSMLRMFMTAALGAAIVLAAGTAWRAAWTSDWGLAVATSAVPFVPKALLEVLLAVAIVRHGRRWIGGESS